MGKVKLVFHYEGFNELRKDASVSAALKAEAEAIAARAAAASGLTWGYDDEDFVVNEFPGWRTRARFTVVAATNQAKAAEARNGVLTAALKG
jgi:ribulose 1,5-bisphosphate carboxylase large subunit-like protein